MDAETTFLERHLTAAAAILMAVFVLAVVAQAELAAWAPLQRMFAQ